MNSPSDITIYINSAGCTENLLDGAILKKMAMNARYSFTENPREADLIVYNTCAFKKKQEDNTIRTIRRLQRLKKRDARLIVCGCIVRINKEKLDSIFDGFSFAPTELEEFYEIIGSARPGGVAEAHSIPAEFFSTQQFGRGIINRIYSVKRYFKNRLKINLLPNFNILDFLGDVQTLCIRMARGCSSRCGYCAVRFAQGRLVSHPLAEIIATIKEGLDCGYRRVLLTATNISLYGKDRGGDFAGALEEILKLKGDYQIIIQNLEPHGLAEEGERYLGLLASPKILSICCPINSGSQRILDRMRREYDIRKVAGFLRELRPRNPAILIRTEFIVGYPGETWRDFFKTIALVLKFRFDLIDCHYYTPRPKIEALKLDQQVSFPVRYLRYIILQGVVFLRVMLRKLRPI